MVSSIVNDALASGPNRERLKVTWNSKISAPKETAAIPVASFAEWFEKPIGTS